LRHKERNAIFKKEAIGGIFVVCYSSFQRRPTPTPTLSSKQAPGSVLLQKKYCLTGK